MERRYLQNREERTYVRLSLKMHSTSGGLLNPGTRGGALTDEWRSGQDRAQCNTVDRACDREGAPNWALWRCLCMCPE